MFLVVVFNRDQAEILIKASLGSHLVPVKIHLSLNPFQGVATVDALDAMSDILTCESVYFKGIPLNWVEGW